MKWIDAHCHPQLTPNPARESMLESWRDHTLLACGTDFKDIALLSEMHKRHPQMQLAFGWHPWEVPCNLTTSAILHNCEQIAHGIEESQSLIGEIGLDYHPKWRESHEHQWDVFNYFADLATNINRPMIVHAVKSHHDILRMLKSRPTLKIYLHGFHGTEAIVRQYQKYDVFYGFSVCKFRLQYKSYKRLIPFDRVLLESDGLLSLQEFSRYCQHAYFESILSNHVQNFSEFCQDIST